MMRMMNLVISKISNKKLRREQVRLYWNLLILARSLSIAGCLRKGGSIAAAYRIEENRFS